MGEYTELLLKCRIKENISEDVNHILNYLFNDDNHPDKLPDHGFFKCERWYMIGRCCSYYHIPSSFSKFDERYLFSRSDLKNYDQEIYKFLDWVDPYIDEDINQCIGWVWQEQEDNPTLIRKQK